MKITHIKIDRFRNLRNVSFSIPRESKLVCLTGENGTGKSNVLELVSLFASRVGLAAGAAQVRGNPFSEEHQIEVIGELTGDPQIFLGDKWRTLADKYQNWDRTFIFKSTAVSPNELTLGGMPSSAYIANQIVEALKEQQSTFYLTLDADRSYPAVGINAHDIVESMRRNWDSSEWTKKRSHTQTSTMYQDWLRYLLSKDAQSADAFQRASREALDKKLPQPPFSEVFSSYKEALSKVLPHLRFIGADRQINAIFFDSAGTALEFHRLSGGEREIAFLVGQVIRFNLQRGLFLVDEPELHLNPNLLRSWIGYLRSAIDEGQTWLATHSLEAAECAGPSSVFVFNRSNDENIRTVSSVSPLSDLNGAESLAAALGSPAFSLNKFRFIYVEGEIRDGERARFMRLFDKITDAKFLEAEGCNEVIKRRSQLKELQIETGSNLRVGGIVDRDFNNPERIASIQAAGLFVLPFHEIENIFLHPETVQELAVRAGSPASAAKIIQEASDRHAGQWIFQYFGGTVGTRDLDLRPLKAIAGRYSWHLFDTGDESTREEWLGKLDLSSVDANAIRTALQRSITAYKGARTADTLWKLCLGKQVLIDVAKSVGLSKPDIYELQVADIWQRGPIKPPQELAEIEYYINSI